MTDIVERLRSSQPLPICPFDKKSPDYYTTPNDKPCKFCGGEPEGPDRCTGADTRIMGEAADIIDRLRQLLSEAEKREKEARTGWTFAEGDLVRKKSGSWWEGRVVGTYSTKQTPRGYAVQLDKPFGPVQIYPESALELAFTPMSEAELVDTLSALQSEEST